MSAVLHTDVLIVLEGRRRLRWSSCDDGWVLSGVWPDTDELASLQRHLHERRPLFIVLDHALPEVAAPRDEVPTVPAGVIVRAEDDDTLKVVVPVLDWLPPRLRQRGRQFAAEARARLWSTPTRDLPPFLLEDAPADDDHVRFAQRTSTGEIVSDAVVCSLAAAAFGGGSALAIAA
jgi:hypothetical protein